MTIDDFETDVPAAYVPLDPDDAVHCAAENDERVAFGATKEVGPHLIVAVKSRLRDRQVWMCRECDARRESAAAFVEVDCR